VQDGETCVLTTSCLLSGQPFPAASIADKDTHLAAIPSSFFRELMSVSPEFRSFVLDNYGVMLSSLISLIDQVAFDKIDQRLARYLLMSANDNDAVFNTHQQLALDLGSVREVISRQLQDWEMRGLIKTSRGKIVVLDKNGLIDHVGLS
ncbi:MAG: Crp/Fnr family transcriptional regulator, partial [Pseudomonadota bacterium]